MVQEVFLSLCHNPSDGFVRSESRPKGSTFVLSRQLSDVRCPTGAVRKTRHAMWNRAQVRRSALERGTRTKRDGAGNPRRRTPVAVPKPRASYRPIHVTELMHSTCRSPQSPAINMRARASRHTGLVGYYEGCSARTSRIFFRTTCAASLICCIDFRTRVPAALFPPEALATSSATASTSSLRRS